MSWLLEPLPWSFWGVCLVLVRDLGGGGRDKCEKKTEILWAAHASLGGLFCFLVTVVEGAGRLLRYSKPS